MGLQVLVQCLSPNNEPDASDVTTSKAVRAALAITTIKSHKVLRFVLLVAVSHRSSKNGHCSGKQESYGGGSQKNE